MSRENSAPMTRNVVQSLKWMILSFIPASLMVGVTTYSMTKSPTAPLLWLLPVSIYFQSLFLALGIGSSRLACGAAKRLGVPVTVVLFLTITALPLPAWYVLPLHFAAFAVAAVMCHAFLGDRVPSLTHRFAFFTCVAAGASLGILFNVVIAPRFFSRLQEYPLMLACACVVPALMSTRAALSRMRVFDVAVPSLVAALVFFSLSPERWFVGNLLIIALTMAVPALITFGQARRPVRFAASIAAMVLVASVVNEHQPRVPRDARSFFGTPQQSLEQHLREAGRTSKGF